MNTINNRVRKPDTFRDGLDLRRIFNIDTASAKRRARRKERRTLNEDLRHYPVSEMKERRSPTAEMIIIPVEKKKRVLQAAPLETVVTAHRHLRVVVIRKKDRFTRATREEMLIAA